MPLSRFRHWIRKTQQIPAEICMPQKYLILSQRHKLKESIWPSIKYKNRRTVILKSVRTHKKRRIPIYIRNTPLDLYAPPQNPGRFVHKHSSVNKYRRRPFLTWYRFCLSLILNFFFASPEILPNIICKSGAAICVRNVIAAKPPAIIRLMLPNISLLEPVEKIITVRVLS